MRILMLALVLASTPGADSLDRDLAQRMERDHVPGLTFAVARHGRLVRTGAHGQANVEWSVPMTADARFEIASISKQFVGASIRLLVEEGKLDLETPVARFFDGLPGAWAGMRVRHLVTMSSGLPEDWASPLIPYDAEVLGAYDDASMVHAFTTLPMAAPAGREYHYSSPGYALLAQIVAKVSGQPFPEFARQRLFVPAGMTESRFIDNAAVVPRRADGYRREKETLRRGWFMGQYLHARPDVGVLSTAGDMARWVIALESGKLVGTPQALWEPTRSDAGHALDYAYGWISDTWLGHRRLEHSGGFRTGFHTFLARYPDDDLTVVVLTNCNFSPVGDYVSRIARAFLPDVPDPAAEAARADADPETTARLAGLLSGIVAGRMDPSLATADAFEPVGIDEAAGFLKAAGPFRYAGRARLAGAGMQVHGHHLVDYETLATEIEGETTYFTLYRDEQGRVGYLELTN